MMMEAHAKERERVQRLREASDWLLTLQSAKPDEETIDEWLRWCDAHAENFNTFQRLQEGWKELDALKPHARALRDVSLSPAGGRVAEGADEIDLVLTPAQKSALLAQERQHLRDALPRWEAAGRYSGSSGRRFSPRTWALAAGLGTLALALGIFHDRLPWRGESSEGSREVAAALVNRAATLPDGSRMILGAQSRVNMNFEGPQRQLDLSKGEAYFKVKHDKSRPFIVQAGEISVKAVGTAFDVRRDRDQVIITVEEGTVDVSSRAPGRKPATWRAQAGYQVTYSTKERSASIASVNASAELAWRNGELAYVREPLTSVVEDLNRYSTQKVVLEDAQVAELRFTGTAFATSVEEWATGISQIYPLEVRKTASGELILSSRK